MNVTKVKLNVDQSLFGRCYFEGTIFYISSTYRRTGSTVARSDVFNESGDLVGDITGHYFDFGNKLIFSRVEK
jgi:hypothetical protein